MTAGKTEYLGRGMRVGLYGGTFDPPHSGHLHVARTAMRRLDLDRVWWLVSPQNPLKSRQADDYARRLAGVAQLASGPGMVVSDIETRLGINRTVDLARYLSTRHPDVHFVWVMGADNLAGFHRWAEWREVFETLPIAVVSRPQDAIRARLSTAASLYSGSRIRESEACRLPLAPAPAWTYLTERLNYHSSTALRARN